MGCTNQPTFEFFLKKRNEKKNKRANEYDESKSVGLKRSWKINVAKNFWEKAKRKVINAIRDFIQLRRIMWHENEPSLKFRDQNPRFFFLSTSK